MPILIHSHKIWDHALHNAFTDLVVFRNKFYCVFRESDTHQDGKNGVIRLICSSDTVTWSSIYLWEEEGVDLRDPKLSITSEDHLMLLAGGSTIVNGLCVSRQSRVSFSQNGTRWTPLKLILYPQEWLWKVTWYEGKAYGVSYRQSDPLDRKKEWMLTLFSTSDGINYHLEAELDVPGHPNETALQFTSSGEMIALVRRDSKDNNEAWIGMSSSPYDEWQWVASKHYLGGPNLIVLDNGAMWAAGRYVFSTPYGRMAKTVLNSMEMGLSGSFLTLPSGGDTSYPGLVFHDGYLWMSYYSSHEGKADIYFAKIKVN